MRVHAVLQDLDDNIEHVKSIFGDPKPWSRLFFDLDDSIRRVKECINKMSAPEKIAELESEILELEQEINQLTKELENAGRGGLRD